MNKYTGIILGTAIAGAITGGWKGFAIALIISVLLSCLSVFTKEKSDQLFFAGVSFLIAYLCLSFVFEDFLKALALATAYFFYRLGVLVCPEPIQSFLNDKEHYARDFLSFKPLRKPKDSKDGDG